jgi:hypothetical protein
VTEEERKAAPGPGEPKAPARPSLAVAAMPVRGRNRGGASAGAVRRRASRRRVAELQEPEVRTDLDWRVSKCEWECSTGNRLGSIPQASARARQQATREQVEGQWCKSRTGTAHRRCDQAWRSCRRLRGCADRVSAAHAREQRRLSPRAGKP